MKVAVAQCAPAFLDPAATTERVVARVHEAGAREVELLAFGETFLPGYPFWLTHTNGSAFDDPEQKRAWAAYVGAAVRVDGPELRAIATASAEAGVAVVLGIVEGTASSTSVFCSAVTIDPERGVVGVHRKLVPTWEERLAWTPGDGHGLRVHALAGARVSTLNCWENWMPQARFALWAQAPSVHVALWPGSPRLTRDITRFAALEGRCFVISASALLRRGDIGPGFEIARHLPRDREIFYRGGSAIAGPDGAWIVEPVVDDEALIVADLDLRAVARERHNLDVAGHYHRPDVFRFEVDRSRRLPAEFIDSTGARPATNE